MPQNARATRAAVRATLGKGAKKRRAAQARTAKAKDIERKYGHHAGAGTKTKADDSGKKKGTRKGKGGSSGIKQGSASASRTRTTGKPGTRTTRPMTYKARAGAKKPKAK